MSAVPGLKRCGGDGALFIADNNNHVVRVIRSDGTITTVAGTGAAADGEDDRPARDTALNRPDGVAVAPDGTIAIADTFNHRARRVERPLPGFGPDELAVASDDGTELYRFDYRGRHLETEDALTGATRLSFAYDGEGRLVSITDGSGNVTTVLRPNGVPTAIRAPGGQQTRFTVFDTGGYVARLENDADEAYVFTYSPEGLLQTLRDPRGSLWQYTYDLGRLTTDEDPAGGVKTLARTVADATQTVTVTTAVTAGPPPLTRQQSYAVEMVPPSGGAVLPRGGVRRTTTFPGGLEVVREFTPEGTRTTRLPDGRVVTRTSAPDPRFGGQAPRPGLLTVAIPNGGPVLTVSETATFEDTEPRLRTDVLVNARLYRRRYDTQTRTLIETTPGDRSRTTVLDPLGRVVSETVSGLVPTTLAYDPLGRVERITRGSGPTARAYVLAYDPRHRLQSITDPLARVVTFDTYDLADRVRALTLPGPRALGLGYDASGNVTEITPPGRPVHGFTHTPVHLEETYTPPDVGEGGTTTTNTSNLARQLEAITRPGSPFPAVDFGYDATSGRLTTITTAAGTTTVDYHPTAGTLERLTAPGCALPACTVPGSVTTDYAYDGHLLRHAIWSGPVAGTVAFLYNADFQPRETTVTVGATSHTVTRGYDPDTLLTQAGALTLVPDPDHGLVTGTTLGVVTDTRAYNAFGELRLHQVVANGTERFRVVIPDPAGRDALGRIVETQEWLDGVAQPVRTYEYDPAGRLWRVRENGTLTAEYTYDANGNRLTAPNLVGPAGYDAQDRLTAYGALAYTYTPNGELATKAGGGQVTTYGYDALGNLRTVGLPTGATLEYLIDGQNRRVGKLRDGVLEQAWLWEDQLRVAAELDGAGNVVSRFVYGTRVNVPEYLVRHPGTAQEATYRLVTDHLGSPRLVINTDTGAVAQRLDYDEFGRVLLDTNPGFQPFGFAGGLYDRDTGFVRFGARDYDPATGRWTAKDPIRFAGGDANLYGYSLGDPINGVDPLGLAVGDRWDPRTYVDYAAGVAGGTLDFYEQYRAMRDANTIGADQFFHCMANCLAWSRGPGGQDAAKILSEGRELYDEYVKGDPRSVCDEDRAANRQGRDPAFPPDADCAERCSSLAPPWFRP
jgi:RHS repeat-associated protein